jgi:hypothetical protein
LCRGPVSRLGKWLIHRLSAAWINRLGSWLCDRSSRLIKGLVDRLGDRFSRLIKRLVGRLCDGPVCRCLIYGSRYVVGDCSYRPVIGCTRIVGRIGIIGSSPIRKPCIDAGRGLIAIPRRSIITGTVNCRIYGSCITQGPDLGRHGFRASVTAGVRGNAIDPWAVDGKAPIVCLFARRTGLAYGNWPDGRAGCP